MISKYLKDLIFISILIDMLIMSTFLCCAQLQIIYFSDILLEYTSFIRINVEFKYFHCVVKTPVILSRNIDALFYRDYAKSCILYYIYIPHIFWTKFHKITCANISKTILSISILLRCQERTRLSRVAISLPLSFIKTKLEKIQKQYIVEFFRVENILLTDIDYYTSRTCYTLNFFFLKLCYQLHVSVHTLYNCK